MKNEINYAFDYENECQRRDAPEEGMGEWLDMQAEGILNKLHGGTLRAFCSRLEKQKGGNHIYIVTLKPLFS